jgi:hypothetical protein
VLTADFGFGEQTNIERDEYRMPFNAARLYAADRTAPVCMQQPVVCNQPNTTMQLAA